ncbi:MAG: hypothetical protein NTW86_22735, partial [Candidatus Sumerlaeota bacterium]|nr:hypothetical protein [Candidatus Sumerlaeota bacterium]
NADGLVSVLAVSETVYAAGGFKTIGGLARNGIAALDVSGAATAWNPDMARWGEVNALAVSGSTEYVGGWFDHIGGQARSNIAALNAAGSARATAWNPGADSSVKTLVASGSTVYAGGWFARIGGQARNCVAALDANSTGTATAWNPGADRWVESLAVSGPTVYAAGGFTRVGGEARNGIAALDAATGAATDWNPGAGRYLYWVDNLALANSTVYAAGYFEQIGGERRGGIAGLDLATGTANSWNPRFRNIQNSDYVSFAALAVLGSVVYVGGDFAAVNGDLRPHLAQFDTPCPILGAVTDNLNGTSRLTWTNPNPPPAQFLGLAWDIGAAAWVNRGWGGGPWFPYPPAQLAGDIDLGFSGGYHIWIANQYGDGTCFFCPNPWTGIQYGGVPHTPADVSVEDFGARHVRLRWRPEIYGTWHWQIIVYQEGVGFVPVDGPNANALWHFIDYGGQAYTPGQADFFGGTADFALPADGVYWLYIRAAGWLPPYDPPTTGAFATASISVTGN